MLKIRNLERGKAEISDGPLLSVTELDVKKGGCVCVSGSSGSGKSVFLRAVADLDPASGEIFLDGVERNKIAAPLWRRKVAYVPAASGWWYDYVGQHFENQEAARELAGRLDLSSDVLSWPVGQLSTGERQRLGLVRTLILNPQVLLLDEPTSGLDPDTTQLVEAILFERLNAGVGIILVSHDPQQQNRLATLQCRMTKGVLSTEKVDP